MTRPLTALAAALLALASTARSAEPPNIVLIISDDQAWNDYGFMGHPDIATPHLDALASGSAVFRRGYVPTALCRPSLVTLLTGRYAHQHGVTGNDPSRKRTERGSPAYNEQRAALIAKLDGWDTLPELLAERGYLSHQSGKHWEGSYQHAGFSHGMTRGFPGKGGRHGDDGLKIGREGLAPVAEFIEHAEAEGKPYFLWYAPFLPHTPHNPPPKLLAKYLQPGRPAPIAKYYAMCEWFDQTCGELLELVDAENTLVVYVTDNGWIQDPKANGYAPRSKQTPYEGGVRTPILYRWPDVIPAGERPELATSLDIVPTVLAAAGARTPEGLPGLNLLPHLKSGGAIPRDTIFGEGFAHDIADIDDPEASLLYRWCIEGRWKLLLTYDGEVAAYASTHPRTERRPQLFDLLADPAETTNLAKDHPDVVARLVGKIDAWYPVEKREVIKAWSE